MQRIGERTEYFRKDGSLFLIINSTVETWKKAILAIWWISWLICGLLIIRESFVIGDKQVRLFIFAFLTFWGYYLYKIGKVLFWRFSGREFIRIDEDKITVKRALSKYGKAHVYFIENISDLEIIKSSPTAFFRFMENSFWVIGAETIQFKHMGKHVRLGIQLQEKESQQVLRLLQAEFKKRKKTNFS